MAASYFGILQPLDRAIYDLAIRGMQRAPDPTVAIVVVDDDALAVFGRWPWPRRIHAELVRKLTAAGARGIGMDILFAEADEGDPDGDRMLARAIQESGRVVLPVFPAPDGNSGRLRESLPLLPLRSGASLGHVDVELDPDGMVRGLYLLAGLGRPRWPAFSLALLQQDPPPGWHLPAAQRNPEREPAGTGVWVRDRRVLIPYTGPQGHYPLLSYVDVLDRPAGSLGLQDKWVLVGVVATGIGDSLPVPATGGHRLMSGIEFNANVLDALLNDRMMRPLGPLWSALLTGLLVLSPAVAARRWHHGALAWSLFLLLTLAIDVTLLAGAGLWYPPASALLATTLGLLLWHWLHTGGRLRRVELESEVVRASLTDLDSGLISTDAAGCVEYLNPAAERLLGRPLVQLRGRPVTEMLVCEALSTGAPLPVETKPEGEQVRCRLVGSGVADPCLWLTMRAIRDKTGRVHGRILTLRDRATGEQGGGGAVQIDPVTGLPGRSLMMIQLKQVLSRAARSGGEVALLYIRLDRFRRISAGMGFQALERLLEEVAFRLRNTVRESDVVARHGSDEFTVLLDAADTSAQAATRVGRKLLEELTRPYFIDGQRVQLLVYIGVCAYPHDGRDAEELLQNACSAVNHTSGRSGLHFFSRSRQRRTEQQQRLESDLAGALERGELELRFQPQIDIASSRMVAAEVLLRWRRNGRDLVSPMEFIPIAEECGLIQDIGLWVFEQACRHLTTWEGKGLWLPRLAINVSPVQLEGELTQMLAQVMERHGVDPSRLELELTEGAIIQAMESAVRALSAFQKLGGSVAVDDFGTGYSTFSYLRQLPIDRIKIDKSFIHDMTLEQDDDIIILSIISMAKGLDLEVVAEGVERSEQLALLRAHGCHLAQGYLLSPPLPPERFSALLQKGSGRPFPV